MSQQLPTKEQNFVERSVGKNFLSKVIEGLDLIQS